MKEDLVNRSLLFVGTEFGLWVSLNGGPQWVQYKGGELPSVPLGMTEEQCRELAADLMEAAHRLKGGKGWGRPKPN